MDWWMDGWWMNTHTNKGRRQKLCIPWPPFSNGCTGVASSWNHCPVSMGKVLCPPMCRETHLQTVRSLQTCSSAPFHRFRQMAKINAVTLSTYSFFGSEERRNLIPGIFPWILSTNHPLSLLSKRESSQLFLCHPQVSQGITYWAKSGYTQGGYKGNLGMMV